MLLTHQAYTLSSLLLPSLALLFPLSSLKASILTHRGKDDHSLLQQQLLVPCSSCSRFCWITVRSLYSLRRMIFFAFVHYFEGARKPKRNKHFHQPTYVCLDVRSSSKFSVVLLGTIGLQNQHTYTLYHTCVILPWNTFLLFKR